MRRGEKSSPQIEGLRKALHIITRGRQLGEWLSLLRWFHGGSGAYGSKRKKVESLHEPGWGGKKEAPYLMASKKPM